MLYVVIHVVRSPAAVQPGFREMGSDVKVGKQLCEKYFSIEIGVVKGLGGIASLAL